MSDPCGCGDDEAHTAPGKASAGPTSANDPIGRGYENFLFWDQAPGPSRGLAGSGPHVRTGAPASILPAAAEVLRKALGTQSVHRAEVAAESARLKTADVTRRLANESVKRHPSGCRQGRRARPLIA